MNRASNFKEMSRDAYNVAIGLVLFWGFGLSALLCKAAGSWFSSWNRILLVVVYIILVMIGIRISRNRNPVVSFLGYNLVVVPFAAVLSVLLGWLPAISILNVAVVTAIVSLVMLIAAMARPRLFLSAGRIIVTILLTVIIVELIITLLAAAAQSSARAAAVAQGANVAAVAKGTIGYPKFLDWLVALLFCGLIGYDWAKAQQKPTTLDNAVDSCIPLYMDIVHLFRRLLLGVTR